MFTHPYRPLWSKRILLFLGESPESRVSVQKGHGDARNAARRWIHARAKPTGQGQVCHRQLRQHPIGLESTSDKLSFFVRFIHFIYT